MACGFANARAPGLEADDFRRGGQGRGETKRLGYRGERRPRHLSTDVGFHDYRVSRARRRTERIGPAEVVARYGVAPKQVPRISFVARDPSDKLLGAKGIGAVGAAGLLRKYGSLDGLLADGKLRTQADALRLYRNIATNTRAHPADPRPEAYMEEVSRTRALLGVAGLGNTVRKVGSLEMPSPRFPALRLRGCLGSF
jgi:DNA polymerase-1